MKHTLMITAVIALGALASCNNPAPSGDNNAAKADSAAKMAESKTERNKKVAMDCEAAINAHDANMLLKNAAPGFMEYQDGSMPAQNADSAKQSLSMFFSAFPDVKGENQMYIAEGNNVIVVADWTMTFKNDMGPIKATGKSVKYKDVDIMTFDDNGKVTSHRNIYPNMAVFAMAGVDMAKMQAMMDKEMKKDADKKK